MKILKLLILMSAAFLVAGDLFGQTDAIVTPGDGLKYSRDTNECRIDYYDDGGGVPDHLFFQITNNENGSDVSNSIIMTSSGQLVIGSSEPCEGFNLDDYGTEASLSEYKIIVTDGEVAQYGSTTWNTLSDRRLKKNIIPLNNSLESIKKVKLYEYEYNGKAGTPVNKKYYGVMAQEMQRILPSTVKSFKTRLNQRDKEDTEVLAFNPNDLFFLTVNATKELAFALDEKNQELQIAEEALVELQDQYDALSLRISDLESKLNLMVKMESLENHKNDYKVILAQSSVLMQNIPNPTMGATIIPYFVSKEAKEARIIINDFNGRVILEQEIQNTGDGEYYLDLNRLNSQSGNFNYSLIVDGVKIDTKIITFKR